LAAAWELLFWCGIEGSGTANPYYVSK